MSKFLRNHNVYTAKQFSHLNRNWVKKNLGLFGEKTQLELQGISCLDVDLTTTSKKSCCVSRSFSRPIVKVEELKESIANYGSRVAEKIREDNLIAKFMSVFVFIIASVESLKVFASF